MADRPKNAAAKKKKAAGQASAAKPASGAATPPTPAPSAPAGEPAPLDPNSVALGTERPKGGPVALPLKTLLRHTAVIGSSGSGKTVLCKIMSEELAERGIPIIAVDPQGDIASLALDADPAVLEAHGIDPVRAARWRERTEVVLWTPASSVGVPLSLSPLTFEFSTGSAEARVREISLVAQSIAQLVDYDPRKADGKFATALLDLVISHCADHGLRPKNFEDFAGFLRELPPELADRAQSVITESKLEELIRKLATLSIGAKKLLFSYGVPLNIDTLLGREAADSDTGGAGTAAPRAAARRKPRTRVSVIYLNTLGSQSEKAFFLAELARALYRWMLDNPSKHVQALFYIDEIAPFLPPVQKPACKDVLKLLFKQARKYGISCLMATQNPGDVDYKALSQFSTWALGRLLANQDIKKIAGTVKAINPVESDGILARLPKLRAGQFTLLAPDVYERAVPLQTRWLLTRHETLDEEAITASVSDAQRDRFERRTRELTRQLPAVSIADQQAGTPARPADGETRLGLRPQTGVRPAADHKRAATEPTIGAAERREIAQRERLEQLLAYLRQAPRTYTQDEMAELLGISKRTAAECLNTLITDGLVKRERDGRRFSYFAAEFSYHPKLGLIESLPMVPRRISELSAQKTASKEIEAKIFGMFDTERIAQARLFYFPLWQCRFEGRKTSGILFWKKIQRRVDNIYLHPTRGEICAVTSAGFSFTANPDHVNPLDIKDLDDITHFEHGSARDLDFAEWALKDLMEPEEAEKQFERKFGLEVRSLKLVFLPVWEFTLQALDSPKRRPVYVDAVLGRTFDPGN